MNIKIEDNSQKILKDLESKMPEILFGLGNELHKSIYQFMTTDKIVDTGRLRGSISFLTPYNEYSNLTPANKITDALYDIGETKKDTVIYGSNVEYASFVNSGTSKQRARKFIENGTYRAVPQMKAVVEKILKGE